MDKPNIEYRFDLQALDAALDRISLAAEQENVERKNFYDLVNYAVSESLEGSTSLIFTSVSDQLPRASSHSGLPVKPIQIESLSQTLHQCQDMCLAKTETVADGTAYFVIQDLERYQVGYCVLLNSSRDEMEKKLLLDLVTEIGQQINVFERGQLKKNQAKVQAEVLKLTQLVRNLSLANSSKQLAYILVNDLLPITQADRISFYTGNEGLLAISKVASFDTKNEMTRSLSQFGRTTFFNGQSVEWNDAKTSDRGRNAAKFDRLIEKMGSSSGLTIPIRDPEDQVLGNLIVEYFEPQEESNFLERRAAIENCVQYCSPLIQRMYRMYSIPWFSFWEWMFNSLWGRSAKTLVKIVGAALLVVSLLYAMVFISRPFEIAVDGVLTPKAERHVFSPEEGDVRELLVAEGDQVEEQTVLVRLQSATLDKEMVAVSGELAEIRQRLRDLELTGVSRQDQDPNAVARTAAEIERLKIRLSTLELQKSELAQRLGELIVKSPVGGQVTTPNLEQRLTSRPLNRGDVILTVCRSGWRMARRAVGSGSKNQLFERVCCRQ